MLGFVNTEGGVYGLEAGYEDVLKGIPGRVVTGKTAKNVEMYNSYSNYIDAVNGYDLTLTLDSTIQAYAEQAIETGIQAYDVRNGGFCVVMDPKTGAILAMASSPEFDPNSYSAVTDSLLQGEIQADIPGFYEQLKAENAQKPAEEQQTDAELQEQAAAQATAKARETQWRNKAVSDLYEPGSVFKLITCAAALDAGAVSKNSTFYCGESISVAGTRFHCANHKRHGSQTVTQALENSCNQSFIQIGARLGKEAFCDYFAAFGLREPTGVDLPAEPKKSLYYTADRMGPVELASCAFGQSSKISYMEMAAAVCAVVNGGRLMQPYLVSDILNPDGSILQHTEPVCRRQVIKPETSETMREMMEAVVLYGGGRNARIQGYRVGGKSGTSQKLDSADEKARIASFVAVAPIDDPQFLCLVCLDEPHSWTTAGGSLSAPVCAEVLEQTLVYKGVPRAVEPETDPDPAQTAADLPADGDSFDGA